VSDEVNELHMCAKMGQVERMRALFDECTKQVRVQKKNQLEINRLGRLSVCVCFSKMGQVERMRALFDECTKQVSVQEQIST